MRKLILNGGRAHGVMFKEVVHTVETLYHAFDDEKVIAFECGALNL